MLKTEQERTVPAASRYCEGKTRVPFRRASPWPGPWKTSRQFGSSFTAVVMLIGADQVSPPSSLLTRTYWPVSAGSVPGPEPL